MTVERAFTIDCAGDPLVAIISDPSRQSTRGVLILVGGPQYRVGSHRQFLLLARRLANAGLPVMRFDYRGMGDSGGIMRSFEDVVPDIAAAVNAFIAACPSVREIVLWGLCDAASAALLYLHATADRRVAGLVLVNPWVRSEESIAKTHIKHYYGKRFLEPEFWRKLGRGKIDIYGALRSFARALLAARRTVHIEREAFQDRMKAAMETFSGPVLIVLSGRDFTAKEFREFCASAAGWSSLVLSGNVEHRDVPEADHTFSSEAWRATLEELTLDWLGRLRFAHSW